MLLAATVIKWTTDFIVTTAQFLAVPTYAVYLDPKIALQRIGVVQKNEDVDLRMGNIL